MAYRLSCIFLMLILANPCPAQDQYETITSQLPDSIIHQFESYYKSASSRDRAKFESFVRDIEMIDPKREISVMINLFGKNFYKKDIGEFTLKLEEKISASFPELSNDQAFWQNKLDALDSLRQSQRTGFYVGTQTWDNPDHCFRFDFFPVKTSFTESYSKYLSKTTKDLNNDLINQKNNGRGINAYEAINGGLIQHGNAEERYESIIMYLQNVCTDRRGSQFIGTELEFVSDSIINDKNLSVSKKTDYLLALNKLATYAGLLSYNSQILINYAHIRAFLQNPKLYPDEKLTRDLRDRRLSELDYFEVQAFLDLSDKFPSSDIYLNEAWKIFRSRRLVNQTQSSFRDFIFLAEFMTRIRPNYENNWAEFQWFYSQRGNSYEKKLSLRRLNECWSLVQVLSIIEDYKSKGKPYPEYLMDRFYHSMMIHFRTVGDLNKVNDVLKSTLVSTDASLYFFNNYGGVIPELFRRNGEMKEFRWWMGHIKTYSIQDTCYFLPHGGLIGNLTSFQSLSESEKKAYLTDDFARRISSFNYRKGSYGIYLDNCFGETSDMSLAAFYCADHGKYKQAYEIRRLEDLIEFARKYDAGIQAILKERNSIIDGTSIKDKSAENKSLKEYQAELTDLNAKLSNRNAVLFISLVITALLGVGFIILFLITRKTKNELAKKSQELEIEKRTLEGLSLSIGQIGHLAKNMVSEIHNEYFIEPTQYEIDQGKQALKRLRNIFQNFEENGNLTFQSVKNEIDFAIDFVMIQNRAFCEGKRRDDILMLINGRSNIERSVPLYTITNIIDNAFKHSRLDENFFIEIKEYRSFSSPHPDVVTITVTCKGEERRRPGTGKGAKYILDMLKNYGDSEHSTYRTEVNSSGEFEHILIVSEKHWKQTFKS